MKMNIKSDLDTSVQTFTSDNASSNGNKRTMFKMCLLSHTPFFLTGGDIYN